MYKFCYNVSGFQSHLWDYHKMTDGSARKSEKQGVERYKGFGEFSEEIYHRLFSETESPLDEPVEGSNVFQKLHDEMGKLPELDDLKARCMGNERWSGIGTSSMIDTLLSDVEPPDEQLPDMRGDVECSQFLERLKERTTDPEKLKQVEEMIAEHKGDVVEHQKLIDNEVSKMDDTEIRNAVRKAVDVANGAIDEEERIMDAFGCGDGEHSGRAASGSAGRKLSQVVKNSERLKKIAELAGRLRRIAQEEQRQKPREGTDDIAGIELGRDLAKMVPTEGFFMSDEVEGVFARRFAEGTLSQIEMSQKPPKQQGPIVMVLDSSGSMSHGDSDVWAAAVCLSFLEIAKSQGRAFSVIHFGREVLRVDSFEGKEDMTIEAILDTVQFFAADGGTNFMSPLDVAVMKIKDFGAFKDADIVMVTDGNARVSPDWLANFKESQGEYDFDVYSILVGGYTNTETAKKFSTEVVKLDEVLKDDSAMHKFFGIV